MSLTGDTFYWWCKVVATDAPPSTRYRFVLNEVQEVMDPAAREVLDRGDFETSLGDDPNDPNTSWSLVLDVDAVRTAAHAAPWQTMGWGALLVYEIHAKRFTDIAPGNLSLLDLLADELQPINRQGRPGYLRNLPITALELMPVHEFKSTNSWGYNPAFFFAVDGFYGGSAALARLVKAAHANGRAVLLDLVYNHMNDSPLTQIARDVYRNGDSWGDRINSGHGTPERPGQGPARQRQRAGGADRPPDRGVHLRLLAAPVRGRHLRHGGPAAGQLVAGTPGRRALQGDLNTF